MARLRQKTKILLPRREVLLKGGLGALGIAIGATAVPFKGAWAVDSSAIKSSASTIRMADWNPNYAAQWSWRCLLYTSPSPRDGLLSRMPSSA